MTSTIDDDFAHVLMTEGRIRTRSGPQVMAALRNATLSLLRMTGSTNISASLRDYSWNIQLVKNLLAIV